MFMNTIENSKLRVYFFISVYQFAIIISFKSYAFNEKHVRIINLTQPSLQKHKTVETRVKSPISLRLRVGTTHFKDLI